MPADQHTENTPLFISCASELEPLLIEELKELGTEAVRAGFRGVYVDQWDWPLLYRINYGSRLATRVLLPLAHFRCFDRTSLYRHACEINWAALIKPGKTFAIDANVHHRELRNSLYAAQVVKDAICDTMRKRLGVRPSVRVDNPDVQINLFIDHQNAVISLDTSGVPLHKRGYRQESVEAPIHETLAAAMLRLANYKAEDVFLDPCCGSGTFLIEAALIASCTPPGYLRKYWGFMQHPSFDSATWLRVRNQLDSKRVELQPNHLYGLDISKNAVRATKINLRAAGFHQQVQVLQDDFREFVPAVLPNLILTNPPHGRRLEEEDTLVPLYRSLGDFMKRSSAKPARGYVYTSSLDLAKEIGLAAAKRHVLNSGGVEGRLLEFELY
jgi:putative N6-adenine-specific DNA methylase